MFFFLISAFEWCSRKNGNVLRSGRTCQSLHHWNVVISIFLLCQCHFFFFCDLIHYFDRDGSFFFIAWDSWGSNNSILFDLLLNFGYILLCFSTLRTLTSTHHSRLVFVISMRFLVNFVHFSHFNSLKLHQSSFILCI